MRVALYRKTTGVIQQTLEGDPDTIPKMAGCASLEAPADVDAGTHYVSAGAFVAYPPRPSDWHVWNGSAWTDPRTIASKAQLARLERDRRLTACDWRLLPDSALDADQLAAWRAYRAALRNVPDQAGFPTTINWPAIPT